MAEDRDDASEHDRRDISEPAMPVKQQQREAVELPRYEQGNKADHERQQDGLKGGCVVHLSLPPQHGANHRSHRVLGDSHGQEASARKGYDRAYPAESRRCERVPNPGANGAFDSKNEIENHIAERPRRGANLLLKVGDKHQTAPTIQSAPTQASTSMESLTPGSAYLALGDGGTNSVTFDFAIHGLDARVVIWNAVPRGCSMSEVADIIRQAGGVLARV